MGSARPDVDALAQGAPRRRAAERGRRPAAGLQDFRSYCKPREGATTIRELQRFEFARGADGVIIATVQADAFCHNMVRSLVGSALYVGAGVEEPGMALRAAARPSRDARSVLAAPHPLVLEEVAYPSDTGLLARAELTRALRK